MRHFVLYLSAMVTTFNSAAFPLSEAEQALKEWGIEYVRKPDGTLHVPGTLDISNRRLTRLPDLSSISVGEDFFCHGNLLESLEGSPRIVVGDVFCHGNRFASLKGAPRRVGGHFICASNTLTSLEGAPEYVGRDFKCYNSGLTSLKGGPQTVGRDFRCFNNHLTSLEGAPRSVGGDFVCVSNPLTSLEYAPQDFKNLRSDLGTYESWDAVPEDLRMLPEKRALLEQNRRAAEEHAILAVVVLQAPMLVRRPLTFR